MTLRPCIDCGEPTPAGRCPAHRPPSAPKPSPRRRGYTTAWDKLSKRARRAQPFCLHCGRSDDLQADHLPAAWERQAAGLPVRLDDVRVLCGPCNRAAGPARPTGDRPRDGSRDPGGKAKFGSLSEVGE